ncbi:hypothetical protein [Spongiimicrobium sp. 2-473A-2-J]|uniref:hypothetical protein n=1 Tax=Eudoraea algarum TaxID=3417568 RepID=UPI003D35B273
MAENGPHSSNSSDEIDLGQLFQMIGNGFQKLFKTFLRLFLYLKRNAIVLGGLAILGAALGFGLNQITNEKLKTDVIVKPNLESKNYLYDVVDEIQANAKAKDSTFFNSIGIEDMDWRGFEIIIGPATGTDNEIDLEYLELLEKFDNSAIVSDVVRSEILNKSSLNHRISFYFKDAKKGQEAAKKIMDYVNSNGYFADLTQVYNENAKEKIAKNEVLIAQLDELIANYTDKLAVAGDSQNENRIVLDNEERVDVRGLFELKNFLIRDTEQKRIELKEHTQAISIINFGKPQQVQKPFFGKNIILIPSILIGLFFLISIGKYLNRKAAEMQL